MQNPAKEPASRVELNQLASKQIMSTGGPTHHGQINLGTGAPGPAEGRPQYVNMVHPFEKDFTRVRGYMPFQDPKMDTDELTINRAEGQNEDGKESSVDMRHKNESLFSSIIGDPIPFRTPNVVRRGNSKADIEQTDADIMKIINGDGNLYESNWAAACICSLTGIGCCYVMNKMVLIEANSFGFLENNGRFEFLPPGRHVLMSPLVDFLSYKEKSEDQIRVGPISIIRINLGEYGLAEDNASPVILLPGMHVHNDVRWSLKKTVKQDSALIEHGPVKFITVKSGTVKVCYIRGQVHVYPEGRFAFNDPTMVVAANIDLWSRDVVQEGPVTLVRVKLGEFGFADHNANAVVLLPGLHLVKDTKFKFSSFASQSRDYVEYGPLKFFTVKTGTCRACYMKGVLEIVPEGRYAVNDISFIVREEIKLMQQNFSFDHHPVLLLGGVKMLVEGLLTFQVVDPKTLVQKIGTQTLLDSIQNVCKAELSRVFSTMHIEDISAEKTQEEKDQDGPEEALLQNKKRGEGEPRSVICFQVIEQISPIVVNWGVKVIAFQLESIKMADEAYSREYEQASLATAKAKANLRAQSAENAVLLQTARARAEALKIEAEGKKQAVIIQAQAEADIRMLEARSRNDAAAMMTDAFSQQYALVQQQVEFAKNLKATNLTVMSDSLVGKAMDARIMHAVSPMGRQ